MLDRVRGKLASYFSALGTTFASAVPSPTFWTIIGLVFALLAGAAYWSSGRKGELVAGVLIFVSGFFDIADGAVARVTGRVSKKGAFLDSTFDRLAEVVIYLGLLVGGFAGGPLVLVALSFSLLVSYTRAKADSLGVSLSGVGIGERSERLIVLAVASVLGYASWGVAVVAVLAAFTFAQRIYKAIRSLA